MKKRLRFLSALLCFILGACIIQPLQMKYTSSFGYSEANEIASNIFSFPGMCWYLSKTTIFLAIFWLCRISGQIEKMNLFCWKNVSLLRWIGRFLMISFILSTVPVITEAYLVKEISGSSIPISSIYSAFPNMILLLSILSYIIAEIFALGLRIQEEQELTV